MQKFLILLSLLTAAAPAMAWQKAISCEDDQVVVDREDGFGGSGFQLVIRDRQTVREMAGEGAFLFGRVNQKGEAIIPLKVNRKNANELIGEDDAFQMNGRIYYVKPSGSGLVVEVFVTSQPTGGIYVNGQQISERNFGSCRR